MLLLFNKNFIPIDFLTSLQDFVERFLTRKNISSSTADDIRLFLRQFISDNRDFFRGECCKILRLKNTFYQRFPNHFIDSFSRR